jgi:hypothetical protein
VPCILQRAADTFIVPDLVFSEMKFLQKEKDLPGPDPQQGVPSKKRKKNHTHSKEGEISAFFTSVRPPLAGKDGNIPTNKVRKDDGGITATGHRERDHSTQSSGVVPTAQKVAKDSCLRFGSRDPRHERTSYVSWSESVQAPDVAPQGPNHLPATDHNQGKCFKHHQVGSDAGGAGPIDCKHPSHPVVNQNRRGGTSVERFRMSSVAASQQRMSRSHSYPQHTSSPQKLNLVERAEEFQPTESVASPSSMPPHAPHRARAEHRRSGRRFESRLGEHEDTTHSAVDMTFSYQHDDIDTEADMHNTERETSSDLGRVIQQCNLKFREHGRTTESHGRHSVHHPSNTLPVGSAGIHRRPTVRFSEVEMPSPRIPNFTGAGIYEHQAQWQQVPSQTVLGAEHTLEGSYFDEEEFTHEQGDMANHEQNWDEHTEDPWLYREDTEVAMFGLEEAHASDNMVQRLPLEDSVVAPGFWRPNRLY